MFSLWQVSKCPSSLWLYSCNSLYRTDPSYVPTIFPTKHLKALGSPEKRRHQRAMQRRERAEEQQSEETKCNFSVITLHQVRAMKFFPAYRIIHVLHFLFYKFSPKSNGKRLIYEIAWQWQSEYFYFIHFFLQLLP